MNVKRSLLPCEISCIPCIATRTYRLLDSSIRLYIVNSCVLIDAEVIQRNSIRLNAGGWKCLALKRPLNYWNRIVFIACLPERYWTSWASSHWSIIHSPPPPLPPPLSFCTPNHNQILYNWTEYSLYIPQTVHIPFVHRVDWWARNERTKKTPYACQWKNKFGKSCQ